MNATIYKPDYKNSILGIPNSILHHYGAKPHHATSPVLDAALRSGFKNVVLIVLDGMGMEMLQTHAPEGFLIKNLASKLSSVYPCTTTSALTTLETGLTPAEHGWLGWAHYFKEIGKRVDLFSGRESGTDKPAAENETVWKAVGYKNLFGQINDADPSVECCRVFPFGEYWTDTNEAVCDHISALCRRNGRRYIYAYHFQPDNDAHLNGCRSERVKADVVLFDKQIESLAASVRDTLLVVTADHGLTDAADLAVEDFNEIAECLAVMPTREPRSLSFFVKPEFYDIFPRRWNDRFGDEFWFMTGKEALESGLFGFGQPHKRTPDFLGDYVALAVGSLSLWCKNSKGEKHGFLAFHAGLTEAEMVVPLILIER